jgi:hypothetical protein
MENLFLHYLKIDNSMNDYFEEVKKEIQEFYKLDRFSQMKQDSLKKLKNVYNLALFEYIEKKLSSKSKDDSFTPKRKGLVIDVEEE